MKRILVLLICLFLVCRVWSVEPLAEFLFEDSVVNYGLSGETGEIVNVSGMEPGFATGGIDGSKCLDNTSAVSMGNTGGSVRFLTDTQLSSDVTDLRSFTIMGWMKSPANPGSYAGLIANATVDSGFRLRCYPTNRLRLMIDNLNAGPAYYYSDISANYSTSDWKFFAVVYDGTKTTNNILFYYGIDDDTNDITLDRTHDAGEGTVFMDPAIFYIGNVNTSGSNAFDGYLDTVRFFGSKFDDSGALSQTEIGLWKNKNSLDTDRLCIVDMKFEGNLVSEGRDVDIGFFYEYNGQTCEFTQVGVDGGKCLDQTMANGMGNRGPFLAFDDDPYGITPQLKDVKSFTVTGWAKSDLTPRSNAVLFSCLDSSGRGFEVNYASDNRIRLVFVNNVYYCDSSSSANYDCVDWKFFAVTYDGTLSTDRVKFYYGTDDGTDNIALDSVTTITLDSVIGDLGVIYVGNKGTINPFDGYIDSVKVFASKDDGSAALSPAQIGKYKNQHSTSINYPKPDFEFAKSDVALMRTSSGVPTTVFGANRVVWNYDTHPGVVGAFEAIGVAASQTHNFESTSYYGNQSYLNGKFYTSDYTQPSRNRDFDGNLIEKNGWPGQYYPSCASTEFQDDTYWRLMDVLLPLGSYNVQYDTPLGDRHAVYLGYGIGFHDDTKTGFRDYLDNKYTDSQLLNLFNISNISTFNYKTWLQNEYSVVDNSDYTNRYDTFSLTPDFEYFLEDTIADYFTAIQAACASANPPAKLTANLGHMRFYNRILIPILDIINMEMAPPYSAGTLDEQDAVRCKVAEAFDKSMFGVNDWHVSEYIENNNKPNYMKCLIASVYANGSVMLAPWNIWAGESDRYYGDPDDFSATFHFIRNHAELFDDYISVGQTGVLWNCDNTIDELDSDSADLLAANIPFDVVPLGDRYPYSRIDVNAVANKYDQVVRCSSISSWSSENQATVNELASKVTIVENPYQLSLSDDWVDVTGAGAPSLWVLPRRHETDFLSHRVFHIVNRSYSASTDTVNENGCSIELHNAALNNLPVKSITWLGPETPTQPLTVTGTANGFQVTLPKTPFWSLLTVEIDKYAAINLDGNTGVNFGDFAVLAGQWLDCNDAFNPNCGVSVLVSDLNHDMYVNFKDLKTMAENWLLQP